MMLLTIINKELLRYLKSIKLIMCIAVTTILTIAVTNINVSDYSRRYIDYTNAKSDVKRFSLYEIEIVRPPHVLSIIDRGIEGTLGSKINIGSNWDVPLQPSGYMGNLSTRYSVEELQSIDCTFIVNTILSLMVIFLTYDIISGEKEKGTLRAILSNSVPKHTVLLSKLLAGLIVVVISYILASAASLIVMLSSHNVSLNKNDWLRIIGIMGISVLYLLFYFSISILVSTWVNRSQISLMILLQIWLFSVVIYPNLVPAVCETFQKIPTQTEIEYRKNDAFKPYKKEYDSLNQQIMNIVQKSGGFTSEVVPIRKRIKEIDDLWRNQKHEIDKDYLKKLIGQAKMIEMISLLSPSSLYIQLVDDIAQTGISGYQEFMNSVYAYNEKYKTWKQQAKAEDKKPPIYSYKLEGNISDLMKTAYSWIILFVTSMILFISAYYKFVNKDVR